MILDIEVGNDELTVMDGGYFRLRDVNLSYTIPSRVFGGAIQSLSITLSARNVFLITDYSGIDPETNLTGDASNVFSYDYFNNPNTRSFGLKLDITL